MASCLLIGASAGALEPSLSEKVGPEGFSGDPVQELQIIDAKDMASLDDQQVADNYIDALVEIEGMKAFHATSGFTPKAYKRYKDLLKFRYQLLFEAQRRKMEIPAEIK
jgi:hypothetical protein